MKRLLPSLLTTAVALGSSPAAHAGWTAPQDLGPASSYVSVTGLAVAPSGAALLAWTSSRQDGVGAPVDEGRTGVLDVGVVRPGARLHREAVAGPVALPDGSALLLAARALGNGASRLTLDHVGADGQVRSSRTLVGRAVLAGTALASDAGAGGRALAAWAQVSPGTTERGPHAFQDRYSLRTASVAADGTPAGTRTLEQTFAFGTDHGGQVTAAVGRDGRAAVAFATAHGRSRGVDAFLRLPGQDFARRVVAGPQEGFAELAAAFSADGHALIAWGAQDGGEEANMPWRVRVARISPVLRSVRRQTLDAGDAVERPTGTVAAAALPDGRVAVGWSAIVGRTPRRDPVRVTVDAGGGRFGEPQELAPDGALGGLTASRGGALLATWSTRPSDGARPTQAMAAFQAPGASAFGVSEIVASPDLALPPVGAFLPDGRAVAAWAGRPGGVDPSSGVGQTAVLRVAVRSPDR